MLLDFWSIGYNALTLREPRIAPAAGHRRSLSLCVRELLWCELSGSVSRNSMVDCSGVIATETRDWRVLGRIGRAGEAFIAAFRALAIAGESERHKTFSVGQGGGLDFSCALLFALPFLS